MRRVYMIACLLFVLLEFASPVLGDGGFFYREGEGADLAQTRQEVLLAFYQDADDAVDCACYVLRTRYSGTPADLAWIIPLPATPINVTALESDNIFDQLDQATKPKFIIPSYHPSGFACCAAGGLGAAGEETGLVIVEARGQAGVFEWAALTSTGSDALTTWLNNNGFAVPSSAGTVLDRYIQQNMHFLALRISEPAALDTSGDGEIEIPPIQFICQTSERYYPMAISQISAAKETEVLIYVLADHRAEAVNVPNAVIDEEDLYYDSNSESLTNYESLFTQTIANHGGVALITECALPDSFSYWRGFYNWRDELYWSEAPSETLKLGFLTRLRTVISREKMTFDLDFQDASNDETITDDYYITNSSDTAAAELSAPPMAALLLFGLLRMVVRKRSKSDRGVS